MFPLILAGYIIITPRFLRILKECREHRRNCEDLNIKEEVEKGVDSPAKKRHMESVKDWEQAQKDFQRLIKEVKKRNLTHYRSQNEIGDSDYERMQGRWFLEDMLVRDDEGEEYERLVIGNKIFRPRNPMDLVAFGQYVRVCLDENEYDGFSFGEGNGHAWDALGIDWFKMYGYDQTQAEELWYSGQKPWIDTTLQLSEQ